MKGKASVGQRPTKGDCRSVYNWCGKLDLKATNDSDPFVLAAIYRALFGNPDEANGLRRALLVEAKRCDMDHFKRVKKHKQESE